MKYLIIRRELHGRLSYALTDTAPNYKAGEFANKWRQQNETVLELTEAGQAYDLGTIVAYVQGRLEGTVPIIKKIVNAAVERPLDAVDQLALASSRGAGSEAAAVLQAVGRAVLRELNIFPYQGTVE